MAITDPLILPPDVTLVPVGELDAALRARLKAGDGDFAIARPHSRASAKLVDATMAAILRRFETPTTIVDALYDVATALDGDPEELLETAFPALRRFVREGFLREPRSTSSDEGLPTLTPGDQFAGMTVRSILRVLPDTELYLVTRPGGDDAVLKVELPAPVGAFGDLAREVRALTVLDGSVAPPLLASGRDEDRAWLCMRWVPGTSATATAEELRRIDTNESRQALAACCGAVVDAYAALHARGVIHGDVHEGNVLIDRGGRAWLIDFGLARLGDADVPTSRGGVVQYYEPELARALVADTTPPPASVAGEQYAVAALLFAMFTGHHYLDLDVRQDRALRQIARRQPRRFVDCGVAAWPAVEGVLRRALAKDLKRRYPSMQAFATALHHAAAELPRTRRPRRDAAAARRRELVRQVLRSLEADARLAHDPVLDPPTASVMHGAAGVAFALHRIAQLDGDPSRHALADLWSTRAEADRRRDRAFFDGDGLTRGDFGRAAMPFGTSGLDVVAALMACARGDFSQLHRSASRLARLPRDVGDAMDLVLGAPGALIGVALVLDALPPEAGVDASLVAAGNRCAAFIRRAVARRSMDNVAGAHRNLGVAHGWGGALYALMLWQRHIGAHPSALVRRRLDELAARAVPIGRGVRWPWRDVGGPIQTADAFMSGWCNGSAGLAHVWLLAHEIYGEPSYRHLAEASAQNAWDDAATGGLDMCCGLVGRAYAMLAMQRTTGDDEWLRRARYLADAALDRFGESEARTISLYKGGMGAVLLYRELERPAFARQPLFEREA